MRDQPFVLMLDELTAARDAETDHALSSAALKLLVDAADQVDDDAAAHSATPARRNPRAARGRSG